MIKSEEKQGITVISFSVECIDAWISENLLDLLKVQFSFSHPNMVLNLEGVKYIDSSGFGSILSLGREARKHFGKLKLASPEPEIRVLMQTLKLDTIFLVYEDLSTCINSFTSS